MMKDKNLEVTRKGYNKVALEWHKKRLSKKRFENEYLEMPTTLGMLGKIKGKKILDLGCGTGIYSRKLTDRGAKVKGIDISEEEIKIAKDYNPRAEFVSGDAQKLPYKNGEFDIVLASLVLECMKDWDSLLSEVNRVLKKGGVFVFSGGNPVTNCISMKGNKKIEIRRNYFGENEKIKSVWENGVTMYWYHKSFGTVVRLLKKQGFELDDFQDAQPLLKAKKLFPKEYKNSSQLPYFCTWKWRKLR
jgi:ubiquinone/menaquinone biosynthesis C-methylase UbiE